MQNPIDSALSCLDKLTKAYQLDGRWNTAYQLLRQGVALANESPDNNLLKAEFQNRLGDILWKQGDIHQAESILTEAKAIAETAQNQLILANSLYNLGEVAYVRHFLMGTGARDLAYQLHQQVLTLRESVQDTVGIIQSLSRIGVLHERNQEYDTALDYYQKSVEIAENTDHQHAMTRALNHIGIYHRRNSDLETALTYFQRALFINQASGNIELQLFALDLVGEALYEINHDFDETYDLYQQALAIAEQIDFKLAIIRTLFLLAALYADNDHHDKAIEVYERIANIAVSINYQTVLKSTLDQIAQLQT